MFSKNILTRNLSNGTLLNSLCLRSANLYFFKIYHHRVLPKHIYPLYQGSLDPLLPMIAFLLPFWQFQSCDVSSRLCLYLVLSVPLTCFSGPHKWVKLIVISLTPRLFHTPLFTYTLLQKAWLFFLVVQKHLCVVYHILVIHLYECTWIFSGL